MSAAAVAVLLAALAGIAATAPEAARRRLQGLFPKAVASSSPTVPGGPGGPGGPGDARERDRLFGAQGFGAGAALVVAVLALGGRSGVAIPLAIACVATTVPARRRLASATRLSARRDHDLPRAAELLATCLEAGCAPADAVLIVCGAVGGPVADELLPVAASMQMGADPGTAWGRSLAADDPVCRLMRALARATATGAPLAETLRTLADDERERLRWSAEAAARRAGVRAVGPVAVCFLPAFLLLGVVPVVVGVATDVLRPLT